MIITHGVDRFNPEVYSEEVNKMTTQQRVQMYMIRHSMSQQDFAVKAGISQNAVSRILRGIAPGASVALKLAPLFKVKPETLM